MNNARLANLILVLLIFFTGSCDRSSTNSSIRKTPCNYQDIPDRNTEAIFIDLLDNDNFLWAGKKYSYMSLTEEFDDHKTATTHANLALSLANNNLVEIAYDYADKLECMGFERVFVVYVSK